MMKPVSVHRPISIQLCAVIAVSKAMQLSTPSEQISHGLKNIRLHVMVQGFTFIVFPLIWVVANKLLGAHIPPLLMLGFFYLCALPSTISSSVALTGSAGGNVPAAILNASLSSVLGIFLTPLLVSFVVGSGAGGIDLGSTLLDLCAMLLLPLVLGQLLRPLFGRFFARHKRYTNICDKVVIGHGDGRVTVRDINSGRIEDSQVDLAEGSNIFADLGD